MSHLAIVSCLPPDQTGVADFTNRLLTLAGDGVHGYEPPSREAVTPVLEGKRPVAAITLNDGRFKGASQPLG